MVLMNHGIFSFGANARESYERMIDLVNVLREKVTSRHVAELAAELCGPLFARTTGAQCAS